MLATDGAVGHFASSRVGPGDGRLFASGSPAAKWTSRARGTRLSSWPLPATPRAESDRRSRSPTRQRRSRLACCCWKSSPRPARQTARRRWAGPLQAGARPTPTTASSAQAVATLRSLAARQAAARVSRIDRRSTIPMTEKNRLPARGFARDFCVRWSRLHPLPRPTANTRSAPIPTTARNCSSTAAKSSTTADRTPCANSRASVRLTAGDHVLRARLREGRGERRLHPVVGSAGRPSPKSSRQARCFTRQAATAGTEPGTHAEFLSRLRRRLPRSGAPAEFDRRCSTIVTRRRASAQQSCAGRGRGCGAARPRRSAAVRVFAASLHAEHPPLVATRRGRCPRQACAQRRTTHHAVRRGSQRPAFSSSRGSSGLRTIVMTRRSARSSSRRSRVRLACAACAANCSPPCSLPIRDAVKQAAKPLLRRAHRRRHQAASQARRARLRCSQVAISSAAATCSSATRKPSAPPAMPCKDKEAASGPTSRRSAPSARRRDLLEAIVVSQRQLRPRLRALHAGHRPRPGSTPASSRAKRPTRSTCSTTDRVETPRPARRSSRSTKARLDHARGHGRPTQPAGAGRSDRVSAVAEVA